MKVRKYKSMKVKESYLFLNRGSDGVVMVFDSHGNPLILLAWKYNEKERGV